MTARSSSSRRDLGSTPATPSPIRGASCAAVALPARATRSPPAGRQLRAARGRGHRHGMTEEIQATSSSRTHDQGLHPAAAWPGHRARHRQSVARRDRRSQRARREPRSGSTCRDRRPSTSPSDDRSPPRHRPHVDDDETGRMVERAPARGVQSQRALRPGCTVKARATAADRPAAPTW